MEERAARAIVHTEVFKANDKLNEIQEKMKQANSMEKYCDTKL